MQGDKTFIDSNLIIYAYDISAGKKHEVASKIILDLWNSELGVLSTQVLQKFFVNITQKIPKPLNVKSARDIINDLLKWEIVINNGDSIVNAIEIQLRYKYSFWDSLILEAAISSGTTILLSEDFSDGQIVEGVKIKNPFV